MPNISKNVIYSLLVQIPAQAFGIIAGIFITRMLGPEGKGLYSIFYADITLFGTLLDLSIVNSIIYFSSTAKMTHSKLMALAAIFTGVMLVIGASVVFGWIYSPFGHFIFPLQYFKWQYAGFFLVFLMISHINTLYPAFFQGQKDFSTVNKVLLWNSILTLAVFLVIYLLYTLADLHVGLKEILIAGLLVLLANTVIWHFNFKRSFTYSFDFKVEWKRDVKAFLRFMGYGHFTVIIGFLNYRMVLWMLAYFWDERQVGIFTVAAGIGQILYYITTPLAQVLMPHMSSENPHFRNSMFKRFSRIHFSFIFMLSVVGFFLASYLIPLVYGREFYESVLPFKIIVFGAILTSQTKIFESYLLSVNRMKLGFYTSFIVFSMNVVLSYYLISHFEVMGAAWAQTLTAMISFVLVYWASTRFTDMEGYNFFIPRRRDLKLSLIILKRKFRQN